MTAASFGMWTPRASTAPSTVSRLTAVRCDGPGVVVVGGMLYVTSGYGAWGGAPGNVLLAYSVDGR